MIKKLLVISMALLLVRVAFAQEPRAEGASSPDEVVTGEIRITLNSDYAKLRVDGNEWEEHEFLDNGKTLIIHSIRRTEEHKITLTPLYPDLLPVELTIVPGDWKLASVSKTEKVWRVERRVDFQKATKK